MREECDCCNGEFKVRAMGFSELAQMYNPKVTPESASNTLSHWIKTHPVLLDELKMKGYKKWAKRLTPAQVRTIIYRLGAP